MFPPGPAVTACGSRGGNSAPAPPAPLVVLERRLANSLQSPWPHVVYQMFPSDPTAKLLYGLSEVSTNRSETPSFEMRVKKSVFSLCGSTTTKNTKPPVLTMPAGPLENAVPGGLGTVNPRTLPEVVIMRNTLAGRGGMWEASPEAVNQSVP